MRRFRQPGVDPAADDGEQELVDAEVHAPLQRRRHGGLTDDFPTPDAPVTTSSPSTASRQSNFSAEYFMSFCHLWVASMVRMVPDFERITIDCVLAPLPQ